MKVLAVFRRESLSIMRGRFAAAALSVYLAALLIVAMAAYAVAAQVHGVAPDLGESVGRTLFTVLAVVGPALIVLLAPMLAAPAITRERERSTLDLLAVTPVEPFSIVGGKLLASLAYLALVIAAGLPVMTLAFLFGGVEPSAVAGVFAVEALFALTFCSVAIFFSAAASTTAWSTALSYAAIAVVTLVAPVIDVAVNTFRSSDRFLPLALYVDPGSLVAANVAPGLTPPGAPPFTTLIPAIYLAASVVLLVGATHLIGPRKRRRAR
jgi:ABC-type transport system involved in multi-copper enzyme maturation permease subunit